MKAKMKFENVISSNIVEISYVTHDDCDKNVYNSHIEIVGDLWITYNNNRTYRYFDVVLRDVAFCLSHYSIGKAVNDVIKKKYESEEVNVHNV